MNHRVREAGSASPIPPLGIPQTPTDIDRTDGARGGEVEPICMFDEIRDPELRAAFVAAYEGWARTYPHLLEDWPE